MENILYVEKLPPPLLWSGIDSSEHCVLDGLVGVVDVGETVNGIGIVFVVDFNEDLLLETSSTDDFWDSAEKKNSLKILQ